MIVSLSMFAAIVLTITSRLPIGAARSVVCLQMVICKSDIDEITTFHFFCFLFTDIMIIIIIIIIIIISAASVLGCALVRGER